MDTFILIKHCVLAVFLAAATYTDIKERKVYNKLIIAMLIVGVGFTLFSKSISALILALIGAAIGAVVFIAIYFGSKGGIGEGDVKLAICLALFAGLYDFINIMIYALIYTVVVGIGIMLVKRKGFKTRVPFAPYLLAGCITNIAFYIVTLGG